MNFFKRINRRMLVSACFISLVAVVSSCVTPDCPNCTQKSAKSKMDTIWNIELYRPIKKCNSTFDEISSIRSVFKPIFLASDANYKVENPNDTLFPFRSGKVLVFDMDCSENEPYDVPASYIRVITNQSDPLTPPQKWIPEEPCICCCRDRNSIDFLGIKKIEIRALAGLRGTPSSILYPDASGGTLYEPTFFGANRGGSNLFVGGELGLLWNFPSEKFQIGILTGVWNVDNESIFIPVGIHARYTFNQHPNKYSTYCGSWYIFGDAGMPVDFTTSAPINFKRYFLGAGFGYDFPISCGTDFSIDGGIRGMQLPLPEFTCCPDIPDDSKNPYRYSNVLFLRFGLTW